MSQICKVTHLKHSAFLLETEAHYLLFDYWKGEIPDLNYEKPLFVFASHVHHDHYTKDIYQLRERCKEVYYVLSFDIRELDDSWKIIDGQKTGEKQLDMLTFMNPYEKKEILSCQVQTLKSTDEGVAFLVHIDGLSIYHAGDLHWWEWPGEPEEENEAYIRNYKAELKCLEDRKLDLAFVVLDPRQEEAGARGMDYFLEKVSARYVFPMHLWKQYQLIRQYIDEKQSIYSSSCIMDITSPQEEFILEL